MELDVLIPLIFAALFSVIEIALLIRMVSLIKKNKDATADELGNKAMPYLYATSIVSVLMAICMILVTIMK